MSQQNEEESGDAKFDFASMEEETLMYWKKINAFCKSVELSQGKPEYTFYDGPPFATGLPHYGHILAGTIKDTVTRYAHQTGHHVSRRFGWDCHGLPVEYEIDKKLGLTSRDEVLEMGIDTYNGHCRSIVQRYTSEWESVVTRLGRWIDFKNDYRTMDTSFMESVWWVFKQMYDKGLVYKGFKVMPYSTACTTPLSNFEAGQNYKDTKDPAVVVSFPMIDDNDQASLVAWTTTPWTLPSNLALCVNPELEYRKVRHLKTGRVYVLATARLEQIFIELRSKKKKTDPATVYETIGKPFLGITLVGIKYEPLFDFFVKTHKKMAYKVVADKYVTSDAGTGVVHQAPAFGEDDFRVCLSHGIVSKDDVPCPIDDNGRFVAPVLHPDLLGKHVKDADPSIIAILKSRNRLIVNEQLEHSYPFCWRSDTPLIYKAVPSIFVNVESLKDKLLANNDKTYWVPANVKEKRFHNWLAEAKDWAISRNRFWGTPIPLFESKDAKIVKAIGSVADLLALKPTRNGKAVTEITDLHREFVDDLVLTTEDGIELRRVDEVFDCWFESGSMPYAQIHFPFENDLDESKFLAERFPADFIAEGIDQTRGWFYTLTVIATALYDRPAFKNLIVNGTVLAEDGNKMSKRLKNYPDPSLVIHSHGADALRLYLINSPVVRGVSARFSQDGVKGVLREVMLPWYNAFRFFAQQASRWEKATNKTFKRNETLARSADNVTDLWIFAALDDLTAFVHQEMNAYRLYTVVPRLVGFLGDLTNWYVRLNRSRLKGGDDDTFTALAVLFEVLLHMARLMAPFTPFFAEFLYQKLRSRLPAYAKRDSLPADMLGAADSVHFVELPKAVESSPEKKIISSRALQGVRLMQSVVELGRKAREEAKINMKTPVRSVTVVTTAHIEAFTSVENYILEELNAWEVNITTDVDKWCTLSALPKLPEFAKKLGKRTKSATEAVKALDSSKLRGLISENVKSLTIAPNDGQGAIELEPADLIIKTSFASADKTDFVAQTSFDGALTVAVDIKQDDNLRNQGIAREVVNRVNKLRKKAKLNMGDVVDVFYTDEDVEACSLPTAAALKANPQLLEKANIRPLPECDRCRYAVEIASDIAATPFGSKSLKITLCQPIPVLSAAAAEDALKKRGSDGLQALEALVSTTKPHESLVEGYLDGVPFKLQLGTDFFLDATSRDRAASK